MCNECRRNFSHVHYHLIANHTFSIQLHVTVPILHLTFKGFCRALVGIAWEQFNPIECMMEEEEEEKKMFTSLSRKIMGRRMSTISKDGVSAFTSLLRWLDASGFVLSDY